ncbi:MAG: UDP-N-acetylmuramate dehydrogenase, partial [Pyrinomonadaceae bacterium]
MSGSIEIKENVKLAPLTTLQVGGNARYFVTAETEDAVIDALGYAEEKGLPVFILGGGSNVLISDDGFHGLVLNIALAGVTEFEEKDGTRYVTAQAGEDWDGFVAFCVENNLAGVECLSGIPGFVGGTPVQNVGAYGQEVAESIVSVRCYDRQQKELVPLTNADCGFSYRKSIFNSTHRNRYVVLSVTFALQKGGSPKVVYKDLIEHFGERQPTLAEVREAVLNIRRSKSMVIDAADPNSRSAGSFFKNPIVSHEKLAGLQAEMGSIPNFPFGDAVKIPAAW